MSDGALRDEVVVRQEIILQSLFEFGGALEAGLLAEFADTSIETLAMPSQALPSMRPLPVGRECPAAS
jgi:hypothetical protein